MGRCFVIQPFDRGPFDKRYDDVFAPAIVDAMIEPYRVDRDAGVTIPIDEIETGIRSAEVCLAEITTDNPNVWFELGFAIAVPKDVVLVCGDARQTPFPFDVQHRRIITYKTEAPQDFIKLKQDITERIAAILRKQVEINQVSQFSPLRETEGLSSHEVVALVSVMQNTFVTQEGVSAWQIKDDLNKAGFTDIAISLALRSLKKKALIWTDTATDRNGDPYTVYLATNHGEEWLLTNQDKLVLRRDRKPGAADEDDVPF